VTHRGGRAGGKSRWQHRAGPTGARSRGPQRRRSGSIGQHPTCTLEGIKAHGRRGRSSRGNTGRALRTRRRRKAPRSRSAEAQSFSDGGEAERQRRGGKGRSDVGSVAAMRRAVVGGTSSRGVNSVAGTRVERWRQRVLSFRGLESWQAVAARRNVANPFWHQDATSLELGARSNLSRW